VPEARIEEDRLELELHGPDAERLAGLGFELLAEIELLLPRAVQSLCGRHVRCRLDAAGLREAREAELRARAREAAERALASGQPELLEPLNPAERRLVHLELADRPGLETESLGSGFLKKIRIAPRPGAE
jgi:spoIIIJ-associated protein